MEVPKIKLGDKVKIPLIGLGTWELVGEKCLKTVEKAINLGYRFIDTAEAYHNQKAIGKAIKNSKIKREEIFIISKVWRDKLRYEDVIKSCNKSLSDLQTDYIDLFLIHWPNKKINLEETLKAFKKLHQEEKIKSIGVSNFDIPSLKKAIVLSKKLEIEIKVNEIDFSPIYFQKDLLEFCNKNNIKIIAYSPLGRGHAIQNPTVQNIAKRYNKTPSQIALRWLIQKGVISIPKASSEKHLRENLDIFDVEIKKQDVEKIEGLKNRKWKINPYFAEFLMVLQKIKS